MGGISANTSGCSIHHSRLLPPFTLRVSLIQANCWWRGSKQTPYSLWRKSWRQGGWGRNIFRGLSSECLTGFLLVIIHAAHAAQAGPVVQQRGSSWQLVLGGTIRDVSAWCGSLKLPHNYCLKLLVSKCTFCFRVLCPDSHLLSVTSLTAIGNVFISFCTDSFDPVSALSSALCQNTHKVHQASNQPIVSLLH